MNFFANQVQSTQVQAETRPSSLLPTTTLLPLPPLPPYPHSTPAMSAYAQHEDAVFQSEVAKVNEWWKVRSQADESSAALTAPPTVSPFRWPCPPLHR